MDGVPCMGGGWCNSPLYYAGRPRRANGHVSGGVSPLACATEIELTGRLNADASKSDAINYRENQAVNGELEIPYGKTRI